VRTRGRPRAQGPVRRLHVTLAADASARLGIYAEVIGRPLATAAADLLGGALSRLDTDEGEALNEARRQLEDERARVVALRRQLAARTNRAQPDQRSPRWEWPLDALLEDAGWWERWLPRLYELLGRRLVPAELPGRRPAYGQRQAEEVPVVDARGYSDLLGFLFPPVAGTGEAVTWRSLDYPTAAHREQAAAGPGPAPAARAQVWEPVVRHVAEALCTLESTGEPGADAYLRLRSEAEIIGPWVRILRHLVGEEEPELPRRRLA
jgi:hypothetical protein